MLRRLAAGAPFGLLGLAAMLLARVDGKSPVEYITNETDRERVRAFAVPLIAQPMTSLAEISCSWSGFLPV